jgi:hypothetical protein
MNLIDKSYLHPVLRPGYDDISGIFTFECPNIRNEADMYVIDIHATLENETINNLIENGKAKIFLFIYCTTNFYRNAVELKSFEDEVAIPDEDLSGRVDLTLIISATEHLDYRNGSQHSDYGDTVFNIVCGDILAVSDTFLAFAEKKYDSLRKIDSIISINEDKSLPRVAPFTVDLTCDKIKVGVPEPVFKDYMALKRARRATKTLENTIFLPILVSIISEWQREPEHYEEEYILYRWFRAIKARAENLNIIIRDIRDTQHPFVLAQKLLDAPITRCIDEVMNQWQNSNEGEDE